MTDSTANKPPGGGDNADPRGELRALRKLIGPLLYLDRRGRVLKANGACLHLLGCRLPDIVGRDVGGLFQRGEWTYDFESRIDDDADLLYDITLPLRMPGDATLPAHCRLVALRDHPGARFLLRFIPQANPDLAPVFPKQESTLSENGPLFDTSTLELNTDGTFITVESPVIAQTGITQEFFEGKTWRDLTWFKDDPEAMARMNAYFDTVVEKKLTVNCEEEILSLIGEKLTMVITLKPVLDKRGEVARVTGVAKNVTESRRTADRLNMFVYAISQTLDGIVISDMDGFILYANAAWSRMHGIEGEDLTGLHIRRFHDEQQFRQEVLPFYRTLLDRSARQGEIGHLHALGHAFPTLMSCSLINDISGRPIGIVSTARDISDIKARANELRHARDRAEMSLRAKSAFLANMSHEIRTPLNGIIGMTELTLESDLTPEQAGNLKMVHSSARHLLTVINDILDFSKIEAGHMRLESIRFGLRDAVEFSLGDLAVRAEKKNLDLVVCVAPEAPEYLLGDTHRIRQICNNLIGNAIKFTQKGEIVFRVEVFEKSEDAVRLHFSVSDTGIGILPERQESIFDSFTQGDGSTTRRYGGSGLGLTISRQLVNLMGGKIWLESPNNDEDVFHPGTTFHFILPFGLAPREPGQREHRPELSGRILLVDGQTTRREYLTRFLTAHDLDVTAVRELDAAADILCAERDRPCDLVLIDDSFTAPLYDVLAPLRRREPETPPIVVFTPFSRKLELETMKRLGIVDQVTRPIKTHDLLSVLERHLGDAARTPGRAAPAAADATAGAAAGTEAGAANDIRPLRILLAEDNKVNQLLAVKLLRRVGHDITVVENGQEVLDELEGRTFDILLLDIQMPLMDGFEVTERIRRMEKKSGDRLSILAMTAAALEGDREKCLSAGMDGYIRKPIDVEELYRNIAELT